MSDHGASIFGNSGHKLGPSGAVDSTQATGPWSAEAFTTEDMVVITDASGLVPDDDSNGGTSILC